MVIQTSYMQCLNDLMEIVRLEKPHIKISADALILTLRILRWKWDDFVEKALGMMNKGYGAVLIQNSAGSGQAKDFCKRILSKHTLIASIKMPVDIFIGKANVNTNIYVFKVQEKHHPDDTVKFIDFTNDGYTRANRKKASNNLQDTDRAKERYEEVATWFVLEKQIEHYLQNKSILKGQSIQTTVQTGTKHLRLTPNQHLMIRRKSFVNI